MTGKPAESPHKSALTQLIIERAHSAFVSMDVAGLITEWNPSAERIFGWTKSEVLGRSVADVVMPERYRLAHSHGLAHFLATGTGSMLDKTIEISGLHRDGREFPVALTISPIEIDGEYSFHAFIQDISERRRAAELMEQANRDLIRADQIKSEFLAMASHELRTPLAAISGFATTLLKLDGQLSAEQRLEFLQIIDRQAARLSRLVEDLLTLSKIEGGHLRTEPQQVDISAAIAQTLEDLNFQDVEVDCPAQLSALADPDHLQHIITNYIANAVKYGEPPIEIVVRLVKNAVVIAVCDHGDGVPAAFAAKLFERFERATTTRDIEGSGLGLSIVLGLARAQGGDAWHEANQPTGSRFCLSLPAEAVITR
ncbi:MAG: PAS domain S-box protein [Thermoleophilia bacterium]|nr:PAS domain S-box protein [Thermoleophilia bacterium]